MKEISNKPQHRDHGVYCSSFCGRGCTLKEHDRAIKESIKMAEGLKEHGWKPDVFENLGWHYRLVKGENFIAGFKDDYTAYIYLGGQQFVAKGKTPKKALKEAIRVAQNLAQAIAEDTVGLIS